MCAKVDGLAAGTVFCGSISLGKPFRAIIHTRETFISCMVSEEDIRLHRRRPKRSVVLATRHGAVTPAAETRKTSSEMRVFLLI